MPTSLRDRLAPDEAKHEAVTDQICDSPTVRTLKFILIDKEEHVK